MQFRWFPNDVAQIPGADCTRVYLVTSRDGVNYNLQWIYAQQPLVDSPNSGEFDSGTHKQAAELVTHQDQHWLFYQGCPYPHESTDQARHGTMKCGVGLARWELDRIVGLEPMNQERIAIMVTYPLLLEGNCIHTNVEVAASGGYVKVELLSADGVPLDDFQVSASVPIQTSRLSKNVRWKQQADLRAIVGSVIRLRFHIFNARLYAFQVKSQELCD